jgi:TPR repeat protein
MEERVRAAALVSVLALIGCGGQAATHGAGGSPGELRPMLVERCRGGELDACVSLGRMMAEGVGGPEDREVAMQIFHAACEAGSDEACF